MTWESNMQAPGITLGCFMRKQSANQVLMKRHEAVELLLGQGSFLGLPEKNNPDRTPNQCS